MALFLNVNLDLPPFIGFLITVKSAWNAEEGLKDSPEFNLLANAEKYVWDLSVPFMTSSTSTVMDWKVSG